MTKGDKFRQTRRETRDRRKIQSCYTREIKIIKSHLSNKTLNHLNFLFIEAKWLYNHILSQPDIFSYDNKQNTILVKKNDQFEERKIKYLSAQMKYGIKNRMEISIKTLSKLKKKGYQVGRLKFRSAIKSIELIQFDSDKILNNKYIQIEKVKQKLRVSGLDQILPTDEITNAFLIKRSGDFFLKIVTFRNKETVDTSNLSSIGLDFGISNQITISNKISVKFEIPISEQLKRSQQKLSRKQKGSKNYQKQQIKIRKQYQKQTNKKSDIRNKIVHFLKINFNVIAFQKENFHGWQKSFGSKIQNTSMAGITSALRARTATVVEVNQWFPSTQLCCKCGSRKSMTLKDRIYHCNNCGNTMNRDLNASCNILYEALSVPPEQREFTSVESQTNTLMLTYLNRIPCVRASQLVESESRKERLD